MEKAVIVSVDLTLKPEKARERALAELNRLLDEGWSVKTLSAMAGAGHVNSSTLVILEKQ